MCWQARDGSQLGFFQDDELYLTAAKSLAETGTYKMPSLPGQPYQTKYPPLYSVILSVVWKLSPAFPRNLQWFVLLDWCLWAGFLAVAFIAFRRLQLNWMAQWGALTLLASNGLCHLMTVHFMSEALFSTFVLAAILLAETASKADQPAVATRLRSYRGWPCVSNEDGGTAAGADGASRLSLQTTIRSCSVLYRRVSTFHWRMDDLGRGA